MICSPARPTRAAVILCRFLCGGGGTLVHRIAIVDDNQEQAELLARMVLTSPYADYIASIEVLPPELDALMAFQGAADILFVDVQLGAASPTGADLVSRTVPTGSAVQVIYVSGYLEFAPEAYRTEHTWFLAKPFKQDELDEALGRAIENLERLRRGPILVRASGSLVQLVPEAIAYVESDRRRAHIHLRDREVVAYAKLSELEHTLPGQFIRCHKSFLVNMDYIAELRARDMVLVNGAVLPVSQRCRKLLHNRFVQHVGRLV